MRDITSLDEYRKKVGKEVKRPLLVNNSTGTISGNEEDERQEKYLRIKNSLNKINRLMDELKKIRNYEQTRY